MTTTEAFLIMFALVAGAVAWWAIARGNTYRDEAAENTADAHAANRKAIELHAFLQTIGQTGEDLAQLPTAEKER